MPYTQADRPLRIQTTLGGDALLVEGMAGEEGVSRLYHFTLRCLSETSTLDAKKVVRTPATITLDLKDAGTRYIHGIVSRFQQGGRDTTFTNYQIEIVPKLWFLTQRVNSRIFLKMTALDAIKKILGEAGLDHAIEVSGSPPKREMIVQYAESDFTFISRLMEEEGISYFHRHTNSSHTLVLMNATTSVKPCATAKLPAVQAFTESGPRQLAITNLMIEYAAKGGKTTAGDYFEETPSLQLQGSTTGVQSAGGESFVYPANATTKDEADRVARLRMEATEWSQEVFHGSSNCVALTPGFQVDVERHYRAEFNGPLHVLQVSHLASQSIRETGNPFEYGNNFQAIKKDVLYRPLLSTPRPYIVGTQHAVVVGPAGEEIFTDKYGRVKVQFFWDREGKKDDNSSCWVRVGHMLAGKQWGAVSIPRIGQEVIVAFYEGDPDRPVIIGSLYNAEQMPPYALPANKSQSGLKSRSTLKGGADNFNELRFEDKKGSEEIYFHGEKDMKVVVENDRTTDIGHDEKKTVKNSETITIKDSDQKLTLEKGNQKITIQMGNRTVELQQGNDELKLKMGNQTVTLDMGNIETKVSLGNVTTKASLGKVETEAMQGIELKVGQSSLKVDQMGVTIKGMMVKIEGQIQTEVKGLMTQVNGDAMLMAKGGITMIN
jgi:type VI secretion system secreted protein VgrG